MPLLAGCQYPNPVAAALPVPPVAGAAPNLAPAQGDHVFGDVIGTIGTALQLIFGGGANWNNRMRAYSPILEVLWDGLANANFGHGGHAPTVARHGAPEPDEHAHVFGGYAVRLQWTLCEFVCTGFLPGGVERPEESEARQEPGRHPFSAALTIFYFVWSTARRSTSTFQHRRR
jgi:hypothetical protein